MRAQAISPELVETQYDPETDVLEVFFGTEEPSFAREVDDTLIIDVGMYSKLPTGFQILNASKVRDEHTAIELRAKIGPIIAEHRKRDEELVHVLDSMEEGGVEDLFERAVASQ